MNNLQKLHQAKAEQSLNVKVRYAEGIMTRREWIDLMRIRGARVEESTRPRVMFSRTKYNRLTGWEQEEYERKTNERVPCYNLHPAGEAGYFEISKAEYDYFNNMQLYDDLQTQKHSEPQPEIEEYFTKYVKPSQP